MTRGASKRHLFILFVILGLVVSFMPFLLLSNIPTNSGPTPRPNHTRLVINKLNKRRSTASLQNVTLVKQPILPRQESKGWKESCAICFFGLPRSFQLLVLPSIITNILIPNKANKCDIYLHYYHVKEETGGRSGHGGSIDPKDVWLLKDALEQIYADIPIGDKPHLSLTMDTEQDFWRKRGELLQKYRTKKASDGEYLYYPWMAKSYSYPTSIDNIVKQWHSIQAVWEDMEQNAVKLERNYSRVAMLRNDVVFVTPFDVHQISNDTRDENNQFVAVPNWARFPINDRMIYGPYAAVKVWATERFDRLEGHVITYEPGYGMHSERYLNHSIFPAIRQLGFQVVVNPEICFFRARADSSTWINDCATRNGAAKGFRKKDTQHLVEVIVGRRCRKSKLNAKVIQLHCSNEHMMNQSKPK
jgi:hypothetical protein